MDFYKDWFKGDQKWFKITFTWLANDNTMYKLTELFEPFKINTKSLGELVNWFVSNHSNCKDNSTIKTEIEKLTWTWNNASEE